MRYNGAFSEPTFHSKIAFFYYSQVGKRRKIGCCARLSILAYLALVAHAGVVGDALEGRELVQVNGLDGKACRPIFALFVC